MQRFVQGFLPTAFANAWITNQDRRRGDTLDNVNVQRILRNSENLYIPSPRLTSLNRQPYFNLPKTWANFQEYDIKIIRLKLEFNIKLKRKLISQLSDTVYCSRLFCPTCHLIS